MVTGAHINAYSVRTSGCTSDIVYWRHSIIHCQPITQCCTVWPTDSIVKYGGGMASCISVLTHAYGNHSPRATQKKEEAICGWKLLQQTILFPI